MSFERKQMIRAAAVAASVVGLMSMVVSQPAVADPGDDNGAAVDLAQPPDASFETVDGKRLQIIRDADDVGERVVTGRTAAGEAATIVIQSVPVGSLSGLADTQFSTADPGVVDENPGPIVSGHAKLPIGGHGTAHQRPGELPAGGHEICPLPVLSPTA